MREKIENEPDYMASPRIDPDHIELQSGNLRNILTTLRSDLVLVWKNGQESKFLKFVGRFCGISVVNVATDDLGAKEYGAYCSLIWSSLTSIQERDEILAENEERFKLHALELRKENYGKVGVFGTGPSLGQAHDIDFGHSLNIACNSIVGNKDLLDLLKPKFICAADVVSHLWVSSYAHRFRQDLISVLRARDTVFVTTANFGALILYHYPDLKQ